MKLVTRILPLFVATSILVFFFSILSMYYIVAVVISVFVVVSSVTIVEPGQMHKAVLKIQLWANEKTSAILDRWNDWRGPDIPNHQGWDESLTTTLALPEREEEHHPDLHYTKLRDLETEAWYAQHDAIDADLRASWERTEKEFQEATRRAMSWVDRRYKEAVGRVSNNGAAIKW